MAPHDTDQFSTSFAQQRLWFLDQYEPGSALYNIPAACRLRGPLDAAALERGLDAVVARHETLRTTFAVDGDQPVQRIAAPAPRALPLIDLSTEADIEASLLRYVHDEAQRPFDLAAGPLLRATLLRLGADDHALLLTLHHIVSDGWSMGVLLAELGAAYRAFAAGQAPQFDALPIQYADFAEWQRGWLQGEVLAAQLDYWRRTLVGAPPLLALPTDRPRPAVRAQHGAALHFDLGPALSERLRQLGRPFGATPFMLLAAAFQVLLQRYSGQRDLCIGYPVAGRNQAELEGLIGFFVNTLVLRSRIDPAQPFAALLTQVRTAVLEADAHQDLPFEKLVEELRPERTLNHSPLFQVLFAFYDADQAAALDLPGLAAEVLPKPCHGAKFDLSLEMTVRGGSLCGAFEYATALFDAATIERLAGHFRTLLEAIAADPQTTVGALPLLDAGERARMLDGWNDNAAARPSCCIHELFEAQVARTPDAIAVVCGSQQLSYADLNARANQLAHHLRGLGVQPDSLVALCVERSLDLAVGLLGILKAGAAYVPLDPDYPAQRLAWMLADTAAPVLLTQAALADQLPAHPQTLCLDSDWSVIARQSADNPVSLTTPQHLAYCIYTSGSTGTPKGAINTHAGFVNLALWYGDADAERVLLASSPSFDLTQKNLLGTWLAGGTLIVPPGATADADAFRQALAEQRPTRINCAPSAFRAFVAGQPLPDSLRSVMLGGEPIDAALAEFLAGHGVTLVNSYGPTECADVAICHVQAPSTTAIAPPLGRPLPNVRIYVLDAEQNPVPVGVAGEIHIAGIGVARGYLNRPDLTAERFVPDPFGQPGSRMYRTGDLGRYQADGTLHFLGRIDHQVKLRGLRIELGEIEGALLRCERVREAAVLLREDEGEAQLVGYVAGDATPAELRAHLLAELPAYMVPSAWVQLDALPLNPNGKTDRKALPAPTGRGTEAAEYVAPSTPTETALAQIWAEVLQRPRVGIHDDFFALGGHSLLATQVVSRIRRALAVELPLRLLFEAPSIAQLAGRLGHATAADAIPAAPTGPGRKAVSFAQERLCFLDQLEPGSAAYNIPIALRLDGALHLEALARSIAMVIERHEALRTTFEHDADGRAIAVVHVAPLSQLTVEAVDGDAAALALAEREAMTPFDLAAGPLLRARLLRLSDENHVLLLTLHHIVGDAWSIGVLVREVMALYAAFAAGNESPLQPLPIQYADYAAWQRQHLAGDTLATQTAFWTGHLANAPAVLELPTDRPRPAVQTFRGMAFTRELGSELSSRIDALSRQLGATPFMTLLAAFGLLLGRHANQRDLVIGSPIANRTRAETEPLIGFFINTLALRTDLAGAPSFAELVARTKATTLAAYAHQDLPFEKVVEALNLPRDLSRSPLFQAMFSLQNTELPDFELAGLTASLVPLEAAIAKFDLMLVLLPTATGYRARWEFNTDLFDAATIERMAGQFETLLAAACAAPQTAADRLPLLDAAARREIVESWNATAMPYRPMLAHELFGETVQRMPQAMAALDGAAALSYAELDRRSNQFAHYLRRFGVTPHSLVGLCLQRSLDVAVAVLGVLKAGAACVPMDPAYPAERLRFMARDARAPVIVTHRALRERVGDCDAHFICMDDCAEAWNESGEAPELAQPLGLEALCYVIYTSGSTGQPKGVALPHRMLSNLVQWQLTESALPPGARTLQFSPLSFDVSFDELFSTWAAGGTLVMVSEETRRDPVQLLELVQRERVARLFIPFVALQGIADAAADLDALPSLREIVCGGEQLQITDEVVALYRKLPGALLHNQYGPTESHFVTGYRLDGEPGDWPRLPPIGKPMFNSRMYVLDRHFEPVPVGVRGDLYIAGDNLARVYWQRADLTADRFVPDPHGLPGSRMYKTGDVARYLPGGDIEFLGRADHQVKIRGFRIELAEVEQALVTVDAVAAASATVREDQRGLKKLFGYVVAKPGAALDPRAVRESLAQRLPDYMVPSAVVVLPALPQTPSGKVDRKALPMPEETDLGIDYVAPTSATEAALARIWAEVLNLPRIGIRDDFFELGGHSLLATQVVSRIRRALAVELPLRLLFEAPTIAQLAGRLGHATAADAIPAAPAGPGRKAVSFAQERLCFLDQLEPGSAAYNIPIALRLDGALHLEALARSIAMVIERHEALRTTFEHDADGRAIAVVHVAPPSQLTVEAVDGDAAALALAEREAMTPFDLATGPLLRARLLRLSDENHVLLLTLHHIVGDAWSIGVLVREVMALYEAFAANRESPLQPLPIQYADYAAWQRQHLTGDTLAIQTAFWTEHLANAPAVLELPTDRPRPAVQTFRGMAFTRELGTDLSSRVDALSRQLGATPFMTLLAAFGLLLGRHANQRDLVIGSPIANRTRAETEPLIGFFINTLALRADLAGAPSFAELVARTRATTLAAYAHQDLPFEKVVEALNLPRDLSRSPLFQAMFTLQNAELPEFELAGLAARPLALEAASAKFELSLEMTPTRGGYGARWEFNADLFERATVERMAQQFETLLGAAVEAADACIDTLPLLDAAALQQLLAGWNDSARPFDEQACVHTLFEAQARRTPEAIALVCGEETLSYRELDARADAIAARLRAHGAGPEVCVGVCLERSAALVAALLGTLKAGAAYVPMDPAYPAERLRYMLRDAACAVVLAQRGSAALFAGEAVPLLLLDAPADDPVAAAVAPRPAGAGNTAYVIYTSGSTGRPKGVQVGHRAVVNFLAAMAERPGLTAADTLLAVTSVSFDIAALELYLPLSVGARIVLADRAEAADGARLLELAQAHAVTVMQATPSTFWLMLAAGWPAALKLRALCGGEALPAALLQALRPHVSALWNMYGPTETAIWSTTRRIDGDEAPIGRPIANTVLRVLDANGQPCPIGVAGELHIGGAGLARGYLGRPGLSAERFVPDPWGMPGARLYRTGDSVRWLANGELAYLGRLDQQVKLRGFRIELGEIENRLTEHRRVRQAVAALRDDRLAAYLVCDGEAPAAAELRELLARTLPEHMIPTAFSVLDRLPLTPNGKVDRKALPAPDAAAVAAPAWRAPEGDAERAIAALWQQLLGLPQVGRDDDFFALGGHSLLAAQMVERLRREHGLRLALRDLFEARSLAALAARATAAGGTPSHAVTLRHGAMPPLFLLHPVGGGVGPYLALAQALPESLGVVAFQAAGLDGEAPPHDAIAAMAAAYLGELLQLQPDGPVRLAGWSMGGVIAFELARQLEARGRRVEWVALLDAPSPAELAAEPPSPWPLGEYLADLALTGGQPLPFTADEIERLLAEPQRDAHAIAAARAAGLIPETMSDALLLRRLAVFAAHRQAMRSYRPAAAIDAPLALLRAADAPADARAAGDWAGWSRGGLAASDIPGDHYGMLLAAGAALHRLLDGSAQPGAEHRNKTLEQA